MIAVLQERTTRACKHAGAIECCLDELKPGDLRPRPDTTSRLCCTSMLRTTAHPSLMHGPRRTWRMNPWHVF